MNKIRIAGIDPALNNTGLALGWLWPETLELQLTHIDLLVTDKTKVKTTRRNSDDFRRAGEIKNFIAQSIASNAVQLVFVEVPQGTQSARGAMSNGITLGVLTCIDVPLIQVAPNETKIASVGSRTAEKSEMISWATAKYPTLPWIKGRGEAKYSPRNEHCADAVAIIHAGIKLAEFRDLMAMRRKFSHDL